MKKIYTLSILITMLMGSSELFATTYSSGTGAQASTAAIVAGVNDQEILTVTIVAGGGGALLYRCRLDFTMANTNNADISNAKLYYTTSTNSFLPLGTLLGTVANPTGTISFTFSHSSNAGTFYYWLAYDVKSTATNCDVFDATVAAIYTGTSCPGSSQAITTPNPTGFRQISCLQGAWTQKANFGGVARTGATSFSIDTKGYIGCGEDGTTRRKDFWEWNQTTNTWTQKADFGGIGRIHASGFSIDTKGYIGTGMDISNNKYNDFWEYDPSNNSWTQKTNAGTTNRHDAVAFSIGTKGYFGTGDNTGNLQDFWEYNSLADVWTQKANFGGTARHGAVGFAAGGKGYVGTGHDGGYKRDFWEFDTVNNTWTQKANFGGTARYEAVGFAAGGKGYMGTGKDSAGNFYKDFWEYNPANDTWTQLANLTGTARNAAIGFSIGTKGYIGMGDSTGANYLNDFYEFSPCGLIDTDTDGTFNDCDTDDDNDGIPDATEGSADTDSDGIINSLDTDSDGNGITDALEGSSDYDGDGIGNYADSDNDQDGINDAADTDAGITITSSNMPSIGQVMKLANDTAPVSVNLGPSGVYQIWNLTSIQFEDSDQVNFTDPNTLAGSGNFPGSTLGAYFPYDTLSQFLNSTTSVFEAKGFYDDFGYGPTAIKYTPNQVWLNFPANYQNTHSGPVSFIMQVPFFQGGIDSLRVVYNKNYSFVIDGWGKVSTPAYSNLNCLRQKITNISNDTTYLLQSGNWIFNSVNQDTTFTYRWWSDSLKLYVAEVITTASGSTTGASFLKTPLPCNLTVSISSVNVTCNGACNGSAISSVSGNTGNVNYLWSNGSAATSLSGLCAGNFSLTVTDDACSVTNSFTISQPSALTANLIASDATCYGCNNGSANCNVNGGTPPYNFNWSNGQNGNITQISGLSPGNYNVIITDSNGCSIQNNFTINQPMQANISFSKDNNNGCSPFMVNFTNQSSTVPVYQWSISESGVVDTLIYSTNLTYIFNAPGNYEIRLCGYDSSMSVNLGCYTDWVNVAGLQFGMSADSACAGDVVWFNQWNNGGGNGDNNVWNFGDGTGSTSGGNAFHSYFANGTYQVSLIADGGCGTDTVSKTIVIANTVIPEIFMNTGSNYTSCPNDKMWFEAFGATGTFTWNFGDGTPAVTSNEQNIEHAFADTGTFIFTVSVTNGCGNSASWADTVTIQNNLGFYNQNMNYYINPNPVCPGDLVEFNFEHPDNFATYIWNFGDGSADTNKLYTHHSYSTAGNYPSSITIINGCGYDTTLYDTISVQNNAPVGQYGFIATPLSACPGDSVLFLAEDGAQAYMWHFGDGDSASPFGIGGGDMTGIFHAFSDTGSYTATLTITNGCGNSRTDTMVTPVVITNNAFPIASPFLGGAIGTLGKDGNDLNVCSNDTFIILTGGSLFHWNFGDGSPMITTTGIFVPHTYLNTGTFTISVIAENSCGNSDTFYLPVNVGGDCPAPAITFTSNNPNCSNSNNGSILVNTSGGTVPYSYSWSNGKTTALNGNLLAGTYSVTVTDVNGQKAMGSVTLTAPAPITLTMSANSAGCSTANGLASVTASGGATPYTYLWSNGQTSSIASNLTAGQYTVTVTAANGCKAVGTTTVNISTGFAATFTWTNITCNGANNGSASMNATGGTTPYTYSWSNGAQAQSIASLQPGTYNATVTDASGCAITGNVQISQPPVLVVNLNGTNVSSCGGNNGSVSASVFGGASPYTYLWSNGATTSQISNLTSQIYSVTVTDANGCTKNKSTVIVAPSTATLSITKTNAACNSACNGTATVSVSGGTSPYSYYWSNGGVNSTASGLCAGTFNVTVVDSAGCANSGSVIIAQPPVLTINATTTPANCGDSTGNSIANCNGGAPPYTYQWTNGDKTYNADSLFAGQYIVTGTDSNGCSVFVSVQVNDVGAPNVSLVNSDSVSCNGENDGSINIAVTGTGTPFTYVWSNGANSQDISNLVAGPYEVTVSNSNGCVAVESITISQPDVLNVSVSLTDATCGNADGGATITVSGGSSLYSYNWSNGDSASSVSGLPSSVYSITVTDANGCNASKSIAIAEDGGPVVTLDSIVKANCAGTGSIYVSVADGVAPYAYSWNNGSVNEDLVSVTAGNYGLIVTDANGCMGALSTAIINSDIIPDPICLITVDTVTGTNKIVWKKTLGMGISAYKIYRESSFAGVYQVAGTIPFDSLSMFVDSAANPLIHSWRYKLAALDSCGNVSLLSGEHKTIHLTVNQGVGNTVNLIWDHYNGFSYGTYYIWRYKPNTGWVVQDSLASTLTSWTDFYPPTPYGLKYFIEIKHPDGCVVTKSVENHNSSRSNKTYPLAPPAANLTATESFTNETDSCNGTASVTASGGISPYSYLWSNGDTSSTLDSLCAGTYTCVITDVDGDTAMISVNIVLVNISKIGDEMINIIVFPNPGNGEFNVQCRGNNGKCLIGKIVVYNILGEVVYQATTNEKRPTAIVDLSNQGSGVYYLQLISENGNSVPVKIVVN